MHNDDGGNILLLSRKAPLILEILQQAGRAKEIVISLAVADQIEFFGRERKVVDQLFVGPVSLHESAPSCVHGEYMRLRRMTTSVLKSTTMGTERFSDRRPTRR